MRNQFVGDVGDFGKYALLNALVGDQLRLGVNWYFNEDEPTSDGCFTNYAHLRDCDPSLYDTLQAIVNSNDRSVAAIQRARILPPHSVYFSSPVPPTRAARNEWNTAAADILAPAEVVFLDPDTGLGKFGTQYVYATELAPYLEAGKTIVIYQHATRTKGGLSEIMRRAGTLLRSFGCQTMPSAFVFRRISVRVYFIVPAQAHVEILATRSSTFLETAWAQERHFEFQEI